MPLFKRSFEELRVAYVAERLRRARDQHAGDEKKVDMLSGALVAKFDTLVAISDDPIIEYGIEADLVVVFCGTPDDGVANLYFPDAFRRDKIKILPDTPVGTIESKNALDARQLRDLLLMINMSEHEQMLVAHFDADGGGQRFEMERRAVRIAGGSAEDLQESAPKRILCTMDSLVPTLGKPFARFEFATVVSGADAPRPAF